MFSGVRASWQQVRQHKLITNAGAYVSGYVLQKAVGFLLIPLWARFLTPTDYGITGTLLAYSGILSTVLAMGLHGAVVRHYYDYASDTAKQKSYVSSLILFQIIVPGVIVLILSVLGPALWSRFTAGTIPFDPYVRIALWTVYVDLLAQIPIALYQAQQQARQFVAVQYGRFILGVATSLLFVVALRMGAAGVLLSQFVSAILITALVLYLAARAWLTLHVAWRYVREGLAYGLPLVPHALASWVLQAADRLILERSVSLTEVGLYNFGYTLGMSMQFLVMGINQAWTPHYFRLMASGADVEAKIVRAVTVFVTLIGGVCLVGVLFAGEIVRLLMPAQYDGSARYIPPVLVGYLMLGLYYFAASPLFYFKKTSRLPALTGIAAALNIGLNLWLIPHYGAIAAAWTTLITYAILFILTFLAGRRHQPLPYPLARYGLLLAIILIATLANTRAAVLDPVALSAKTATVAAYAGLAYVTLLRPELQQRHA